MQASNSTAWHSLHVSQACPNTVVGLLGSGRNEARVRSVTAINLFWVDALTSSAFWAAQLEVKKGKACKKRCLHKTNVVENWRMNYEQLPAQ